MWFELVGVLNELNLSLVEYKKLETNVVMLNIFIIINVKNYRRIIISRIRLIEYWDRLGELNGKI